MRLLSILFFLFISNSTQAATIKYDVNNISGNQWSYEYTVHNDTLSSDIEWFAIYFDYNLYENLQILSTPSNWDPLVFQPDTGLPSDGVYDIFALSTGIAPSSSLSGFILQFDYLGIGTMPGSQAFEIFDPSFNIIDTGSTSLSVGQQIPEPNIIFLLLMGMAIIGFCQLQKIRKF